MCNLNYSLVRSTTTAGYCPDFLTMQIIPFSSWKETFLRKTHKKTFILSLPHIHTKSPPLNQKMYCEMILFYAFNVLKLKLFICSCDESNNTQLQLKLQSNDFGVVNINFILLSFTTIKQKTSLKTSPYSNHETVLKLVAFCYYQILMESCKND